MKTVFKRIQVFSWTDKHGVERQWFVDGAIEHVKTHGLKANHSLTLDEMTDALEQNRLAPRLHPERVAAADVTNPVNLDTRNEPVNYWRILLLVLLINVLLGSVSIVLLFL